MMWLPARITKILCFLLFFIGTRVLVQSLYIYSRQYCVYMHIYKLFSLPLSWRKHRRRWRQKTDWLHSLRDEENFARKLSYHIKIHTNTFQRSKSTLMPFIFSRMPFIMLFFFLSSRFIHWSFQSRHPVSYRIENKKKTKKKIVRVG